jgi:hypothetical protein
MDEKLCPRRLRFYFYNLWRQNGWGQNGWHLYLFSLSASSWRSAKQLELRLEFMNFSVGLIARRGKGE